MTARLSAITHLFAGVPVSDLDAGIDWYTRFFGRPPDSHSTLCSSASLPSASSTTR
jgi:hypothetical protein